MTTSEAPRVAEAASPGAAGIEASKRRIVFVADTEATPPPSEAAAPRGGTAATEGTSHGTDSGMEADSSTAEADPFVRLASFRVQRLDCTWRCSRRKISALSERATELVAGLGPRAGTDDAGTGAGSFSARRRRRILSDRRPRVSTPSLARPDKP